MVVTGLQTVEGADVRYEHYTGQKLSPGQYVTLEVHDNGRGMDIETLPKIFDPFFTTKRQEGGSGLGMHLVYNLVTQLLKGSIECRSARGQGVEFLIAMPGVVVEE